MPEPSCIYFARNACRSCDLLDLGVGAAGKRKHAALYSLLNDSGISAPLLPLWEPTEVFPSRAKAKLSVAGDLSNPVIGLVDRALTATDLTRCPLHFPVLNDVVEGLRSAISEFRLFPYDIASRRGELKGLILMTNREQTEVALRFVLRSTEAIPRIRKAIPALTEAFSSLKVISANIQPVPHAVLEGREEIVLTESRYIWENYTGLPLAIAPQSFIQVTPETAQGLYSFVAGHVAASEPRAVLDLFSGIGGFSLALASHGLNVTAAEVSPAAIDSLEETKRRHCLDLPKTVVTDALTFLRGTAGEAFDAVVVNPPRRGLGSEVCDELIRIGPATLAYSSCNPQTLVSDLVHLTRSYTVRLVAPFDMFPLTSHVETVALLEAKQR